MWHRINFQRRKTELKKEDRANFIEVDLLDDKPSRVDFGVDLKYSRSLKKKKQKKQSNQSL